MADPEKKEEVKAIWSHGQKVGAGRLRQEVARTRDVVAETLSGLQADIEKKRAILAGFGRS